MAKIQVGPIVSDIRGSIGDTTFSRNQGGLYAKARAGPTGGTTGPQTTCRTTLNILSHYWSETLTPSQRSSWNAYAARYTVPNALGQPHHLKGYNWFIKCNFDYRRIAPNVAHPEAPVAGPIAPPILTGYWNDWPEEYTLYVPPTNYPAPPDNLTLWLFAGKPSTNAVNYYAGPWQYRDANQYQLGSWQKDPWDFQPPWKPSGSERLWLRVKAQRLYAPFGNISTYYKTYISHV